MCSFFLSNVTLICGASKIKFKKVNKKRTVTVRRVIIFFNISRHPLLICLQCCLHQYNTLKAVAPATAAIVLLTPAKNLKKVFFEGDLTKKNWFQNLWEGLNRCYFGELLNFWGQKNSPGKYRHKSAQKLYFFGKMYLNLFRQDIKKIFLLIAFQQSLNSGQKTTNFCHYWQILVKNCCRFTAGDLKAFFLFFCFDFLYIDPSNNFCFCKFFAKGLKSEGERLKAKFWSSEMVKIGRGQQNYRRCHCRHRLQSFATMKKTV